MKPYKARSLKRAESKVRELQKSLEFMREAARELCAQIKRHKAESEILAMLAAKGPAFHNPILAMEAEKLRDRILEERCGMDANGRAIAPDPARAQVNP